MPRNDSLQVHSECSDSDMQNGCWTLGVRPARQSTRRHKILPIRNSSAARLHPNAVALSVWGPVGVRSLHQTLEQTTFHYTQATGSRTAHVPQVSSYNIASPSFRMILLRGWIASGLQNDRETDTAEGRKAETGLQGLLQRCREATHLNQTPYEMSMSSVRWRARVGRALYRCSVGANLFAVDRRTSQNAL